jgi:hypothetical protein
MTNLNTKIHTTVNTLMAHGFVCKNQSKIDFLLGLNENLNIGAKERIFSVTFKHKDSMTFAHLQINYVDSFPKGTIENVRFMITEQSSNMSDKINRYINVVDNENTITTRIHNVLDNVLKEQADQLKTKELINSRVDIATEELKSIFGEDTKITLHAHSLHVKYKEIHLAFSVLSTSENSDLSNYTTTLSFNRSVSNSKIVSAIQAKAILDMVA